MNSNPWVVCLGGEDWWYHSHAHFDMQVMKRLSKRCRVLYVCSIGMRMPSIRRDAQFWSRIRNKLSSVARTLRHVQPSLWVYSPLPLPLYQWTCGRAANQALLAAQLRFIFARLEIRKPLFWVNTPTAWPVIKGLGRGGLVYQRTDDYTAYDFDNFNAAHVRAVDEDLLRFADLILHVDRDLHARTRSEAALLLEQGVDERFLDNAAASPPADLPLHARPIIGYVGNLEPHKFNAELVRAVASELQTCSFVIVGRYHQNADCLRGLRNVHFLGEKPHDAILDYVRSFDICMLPTAKTTWGLHCKPIKLMEYLAAGRPVVATDTPAAEQFRQYMHVADSPNDWVSGIRDILSGANGSRGSARDRMAACSWNRQVDRIWSALHERGLLSNELLN